MPTHAEKRILPHTPQQMYDLVVDVEKYPEFLPWCLSCHIVERKETDLKADLTIGYGVVRETFTSQVHLTPGKRVDVKYEKGPMRTLNNHWVFNPTQKGHCEVDFYVDFSFESSFFQSAMEFFFNEAVQVMVNAFEARAKKLYGSPTSPTQKS